jgi:hypothetical protein
MKNFIICTCIIASFLLISQKSNAQQSDYYRAAAGLKFGGYENGISFKFFTTKDVALEGVLGFRNNGIVITGLYEIHIEAFGVRELKFYYGAGAHIGSIGSGTYQRFGGSTQVYTKSQILLGADGVFGLEYFIPRSPIAVSVDLNPRADIAPGLGVKYAF